MPTFLDAITAVVQETGQAAKGALIRKSINSAVERLSTFHKWKFDLQYYEYSIAAEDQDSFIQLIPLASLPRYREALVVQGLSDYNPLIKIQADNATCRGVAKKGTYYESALGLHCSLSNLTDTIKVSYYNKPAIMTADTDTNWCLDSAFYVIVDLAVAFVFRSVGDTQEFDRLIPLALRNMEDLVNDIGGM